MTRAGGLSEYEQRKLQGSQSQRRFLLVPDRFLFETKSREWAAVRPRENFRRTLGMLATATTGCSQQTAFSAVIALVIAALAQVLTSSKMTVSAIEVEDGQKWGKAVCVL